VSFGVANVRLYETNADLTHTVDLGNVKFNDSMSSPAASPAKVPHGRRRRDRQGRRSDRELAAQQAAEESADEPQPRCDSDGRRCCPLAAVTRRPLRSVEIFSPVDTSKPASGLAGLTSFDVSPTAPADPRQAVVKEVTMELTQPVAPSTAQSVRHESRSPAAVRGSHLPLARPVCQDGHVHADRRVRGGRDRARHLSHVGRAR
jgi:hypothetical protein